MTVSLTQTPTPPPSGRAPPSTQVPPPSVEVTKPMPLVEPAIDAASFQTATIWDPRAATEVSDWVVSGDEARFKRRLDGRGVSDPLRTRGARPGRGAKPSSCGGRLRSGSKDTRACRRPFARGAPSRAASSEIRILY